MKRICTILITLFLSILGLSQSFNGTIIRVIDGDTFVFQTSEDSLTIRMYGTDAPERNQPFSRESSDFLKQFLDIEATIVATGVDRYGRTLGILFIDGKDMNLLSIINGCSWHYKKYSKDIQYAKAEESAIKNELGLWKLDNPIPPWKWRKK